MSSIQNSMLLGFRDSWVWKNKFRKGQIFTNNKILLLLAVHVKCSGITIKKKQISLLFVFVLGPPFQPIPTCMSIGEILASLSSTVQMGLPLPSASLDSMTFPEVSPPVRLLSLWRNRDELNTCSTRLDFFWVRRLVVLLDWSPYKEHIKNMSL